MAPHLTLSSLIIIISLGGKELGTSEDQLFYVAMLKKKKEKAQERRSEGKVGSQISPIYVNTLIHADLTGNCFVKWHANSCNCQQLLYSWHQFLKTLPVKSSTFSISYCFLFLFFPLRIDLVHVKSAILEREQILMTPGWHEGTWGNPGGNWVDTGQKAFALLRANCNSQKDNLSGPLLLLCSMREIDAPTASFDSLRRNRARAKSKRRVLLYSLHLILYYCLRRKRN